uniref:Uncharacterized protein n=1 Tax=Salix viminalis TaxID=40686 RepID=A0A6N2KQ20_SALVM
MLGCAAKPWAKTRYSQKETGVHLIVVEESSQYLDAAEKLSAQPMRNGLELGAALIKLAYSHPVVSLAYLLTESLTPCLSVLESRIRGTACWQAPWGDMSGDRREQPTTPSSADIESQAGRSYPCSIARPVPPKPEEYLHPRSDWTYR